MTWQKFFHGLSYVPLIILLTALALMGRGLWMIWWQYVLLHR
ncbi:MAG TPA: hypothetical protein VNP04_15480 [Alphaproteobacteria bacterium]|nr:hypothetical protein [Alphaproteobacteria bacterium]